MSDGSRYILAKRIARGGMAEIFLGKQVGEDGFQRLCAIKRILPHYAQDKEFIQMFRDEAHICKRLQHANIVRVEGFEEVEGSYALIMEFIDGSDLRSVLHACEQAKTRISVPMACQIIAECARGLHYAHTKVDEITQQPLGIVHRDISPQNILVSYEGEVKVTDFGIADAESKMTETRPGIVKGKYSYMSPEQISAKAVDARTDVFALSIVLWEMLAMRRLFQGQNEVETIQIVKNCKIEKDLKALNKQVDADLEEIVLRGLAKDPKRRFQSAGDFEKELRRFMSRSYPDFTPQDLGNFLKQILDKRRAESAAEIKKTLTESSRPSTKKKSKRPDKEQEKIDIEKALSLDNKNPNLSLSVRSPMATRSVVAKPGPSKRATAANKTTNFSKLGGVTNGHSFLKRPKSSGNMITVSIIAAVAAVILFIGINLNSKKSTKPVLEIRTIPSRVKMTVDGKPEKKGKYIVSTEKRPYRIVFDRPGAHKIRIFRPGYDTVQYTFEVEAGQVLRKTDFVLSEKRKAGAVSLILKDLGRYGDAIIDIEDGYWKTKLNKKVPQASPPDLFPGRSYTMKVLTPKRSLFKCRISPKSVNWKFRTVISIDRERRQCKVQNP